MTDTPAGAVFAAVGLYIVSQILDGITAIGSIRNVFPTHYFDRVDHLFTGNGGPDATCCAGTLLQIPLRDRLPWHRLVVVPPQGHLVVVRPVGVEERVEHQLGEPPACR